MMPTLFTHAASPIGRLLLLSDGIAVTGLYMETERHPPRRDADWIPDAGCEPLRRTTLQLAEYFAGERREFDLPLAPRGTAFQRQVWDELLTIQFGQTTSYGALARRLGNPGASRAVGLANGQNPISIIIPCHRVIGADGTLTGYGGGLPRKQWLLRHEGAAAQGVLNL
jgi:methylated-DNA-[protein]-cysteine S-methyltransferase